MLTWFNSVMVFDWKPHFPKTIEILRENGRMNFLSAFDQELSALRAISQDSDSKQIARWLPAFLKMQNSPTYWLEVAEFEYVQFAAKNYDFGIAREYPGRIAMQPYLQFVELRHDHPELNRDQGLYCFFKSRSRFIELKLSLRQALFIDCLQHWSALKRHELIHQVMSSSFGKALSVQEWNQQLDKMIELGIFAEYPDAINDSFDRAIYV